MAIKRGTSRRDILLGTATADQLYGFGGDDLLDGGLGADRMVGGTGNDTYVVDDIGDIVDERGGNGIDLVQASISFSLFNPTRVFGSVENLTLTGSGHINGTGNALANILTGNDGNNILDGGAGADTMTGGVGHDTYVVDNAGDKVNETGGSGTDTVQASLTYSLANVAVVTGDVENLTLTGFGNIDGTGNALANIITGNAGNNTLDGGGGGDTLNGGDGNDTYIINNTGITIIDSSGTDTVNASITMTLATGLENLNLAGSGHINGTGNALANIITGNSGNNELSGGGGADIMTGGLGNDIYFVDRPTDVVNEDIGEGTDEVRSTALLYALAAGMELERLTYIGSGDFTGYGNEFENILTGAGGEDTLFGGSGRDTLRGGLGADGLDGGQGSDTYDFGVGDVVAGEGIVDSGLGGTDILRTVGTDTSDFIEFRFATISGIEGLTFDNAHGVKFNASQFGTGLISNALSVNGNLHSANFQILGAVNFNGSGWTFANWGNGALQITGTSGADTIVGTSQADTIRGGAGADTLNGGEGGDLYLHSAGEVVAGDVIADSGTTGTDTLQFGVGTYNLSSNSISGIEQIVVSAATVTFNATQLPAGLILSSNGGTNTVQFINASSFSGAGFIFQSWGLNGELIQIDGTSGSDFIQGTTKNDVIRGAAFGDTLLGGDGNDTLAGGAAGDVLNGGEGNDTYEYGVTGDEQFDAISDSGSSGDMDVIRILDGVTFELNSGLAISGVEKFVLGANSLLNIDVASPAYLIEGGTGVQTLDFGQITLSFSAADWNFSNWDSGTDQVKFGFSDSATATGTTVADTFSINNVVGAAISIFGGDGDDVIAYVGGFASNFLFNGENGSDTYTLSDDFSFSSSVSDTGTFGTDTLAFTAQTNFSGQVSGIERIFFSASGIHQTFNPGNFTPPPNLIVAAGPGEDGNELRFVGLQTFNASGFTFENWGSGSLIELSGTLGNDTLTGSSGSDYIISNGGTDTLNGGGGDDRLEVGSGNSTYNGDGGAGDILSFRFGGTGTGTMSFTLGGMGSGSVNLSAFGFGTITYSGIEGLVGRDLIGVTDNLTGNAANNILRGLMGDDIMDGGGGNDTFIFDYVAGSSGSDGGNDTINGFESVAGAANGDVLNFTINTGQSITWSNATSSFTLADGVTTLATVTVTGATGLLLGDDYTVTVV